MLALKDGDSFVTIQARDAAPGSIGTIAVTANPGKIATALHTRFPLPPSLRVVNLQQYDDDGNESEHLSLVSSRAPHVEAATCARLLGREGWLIIYDAPARAIAGAHVIEAQKGAEHTRLTFLPDRSRGGGTAAIVIWRKA
jgi:hypothetical protein